MITRYDGRRLVPLGTDRRGVGVDAVHVSDAVRGAISSTSGPEPRGSAPPHRSTAPGAATRRRPYWTVIFFKISLPMIWPVMAIALVIRALDLVRIFDIVWAADGATLPREDAAHDGGAAPVWSRTVRGSGQARYTSRLIISIYMCQRGFGRQIRNELGESCARRRWWCWSWSCCRCWSSGPCGAWK